MQRKEGNDGAVRQRRKRTMGGGERCVSCTTFNILAPIYKRLDTEVWIGFFGYLFDLIGFCSSVGGFFRIRASGRVNTGRIGLVGMRASLIGCSVIDLLLFVFR